MSQIYSILRGKGVIICREGVDLLTEHTNCKKRKGLDCVIDYRETNRNRLMSLQQTWCDALQILVSLLL